MSGPYLLEREFDRRGLVGSHSFVQNRKSEAASAIAQQRHDRSRRQGRSR